ncbi:Uncharacterized protein TCM_016767 [Theobroma cacao]|uniref:Reverse transcriptase domain-containing protein n=1 Tax=Theobroma cacao TaxID=3641 RepID=A0A061ECX2_THECC|nr:Uncharacterized protein TCM_016767 [Theobroma cacao]
MTNALNSCDFPSLPSAHDLASGRPPDPPNQSPAASIPPPQVSARNPPTIWPQNPNPSNVEDRVPNLQIQHQHPVSPKSVKKSFLSIVTAATSAVIPPTRATFRYKDKPAVRFYEDEIETLAKSFRFSIVGKFSRTPRLVEIRQAFVGLGLSGAYNIRWMDYKHVLIHLSNEQDFNRIWTKQTWFIAKQKMRVFKGTPNFESDKESSIVPVWISFPNLRAHLFEKSALLLIAKAIGNPLGVDEATANGTRPSVARVCIEYDCLKSPIKSVWIVTSKRVLGQKSGTFKQKLTEKPSGNSQGNPAVNRTMEAEVMNPKKEVGGMDVEKRKADARMAVTKHVKTWQVVHKGGSSGAKDAKGIEIASQVEEEDFVQTSNRFGVMEKLQEKECEKQSKTESGNSSNAGKQFASSTPVDVDERGLRETKTPAQVKGSGPIKPTGESLVQNSEKDKGGELRCLHRDATEERRRGAEDQNRNDKLEGAVTAAVLSATLQTEEDGVQMTFHGYGLHGQPQKHVEERDHHAEMERERTVNALNNKNKIKSRQKPTDGVAEASLHAVETSLHGKRTQLLSGNIEGVQLTPREGQATLHENGMQSQTRKAGGKRKYQNILYEKDEEMTEPADDGTLVQQTEQEGTAENSNKYFFKTQSQVVPIPHEECQRNSEIETGSQAGSTTVENQTHVSLREPAQIGHRITIRKQKLKKKAKPVLASLVLVMNVDDDRFSLDFVPPAAGQKNEKKKHHLLDKGLTDIEESGGLNNSRPEQGNCVFNTENSSIPSNEAACSNPEQERRMGTNVHPLMHFQAAIESHKIFGRKRWSRNRKFHLNEDFFSHLSMISCLIWNVRGVAGIEGPWMVGGDFNSIVSTVERLNGAAPHVGSMEDFASTLFDCGLVDAGFEGNSFTWTNNHMFQRLDRVVYNPEWAQCFSSTRVQHLNLDGSDHCPLLISCNTASQKGPSTFRFLHAWTKHHDFLPFITKSWQTPLQGSGLSTFWFKQQRLKRDLKWWNKHIFGDIFEKLRLAEEEAKKREIEFQHNPSLTNRNLMHKAYTKLNRQLSIEELFWQQKFSVKWLVEGESNTKFFHMRMRKKRVRSHVFQIQDSEGNVFDDTHSIQKSATDFFRNLMQAENCDNSRFDPSLIPRIISSADNEFLCAAPSLQEVKETVFNINKDSVAGSDGFSSLFYQHCWDIIKHDLLDAVLDFFRGSPLPRGVTSTTLVLLPKKPNACHWSDYSPISLCTVLNKIVTKLLANRLSKILPLIISENQSGFVNGRLISDNILLAHELIGKIDAKSRGGNVVLKLDMAKAYDRLNWDFLYLMMEHFGFNAHWINMIKSCISNYWLSLLINGSLVGYFKSERGLRQGDSISPMLFILAADYLSRGLNHLFSCYSSLQYLSGCQMPISHLSFADDIVIFTNGRWENKILSPGGRITLLRSVLSSLPMYLLQVLKPPVTVIERIDKLFNSFLWGDLVENKKMHWAEWAKISFPCAEGGLGIRKLEDVCAAFTLKLWWRFQTGVLGKRSDSGKRPMHYAPSSGTEAYLYRFPFSYGKPYTIGSQNDAKHRHSGLYPNRVIWRITKLCRQLYDGSLLQQWQWKGDTDIAAMMGLFFPPKQHAPPQIIYWKKPSIGEYKLNVDGSSRKGLHADSGGVLRDHTGKLIFGFSENIGQCNSLQAELHALLRGLLLCKEHHIEKLWIEMDALVAIQLIQHSKKGPHDIR